MAFLAPRSFDISDKRQRTVTVARARRPVDKVILVVGLALNATDDSTVIHTATYPATMTGLRWDFNFLQSGGTGVASYVWAIIYLRDGETIDNLTFANGASLYSPEQNCLVWAFGSIDNNTETKQDRGSTKTMRKMMVGDQIVVAALGVATNTTAMTGGVQLFLKG